MKTKLLSVFLILAMLMTSVLCFLPAYAEEDYDAKAVAEGYVCRVGEANAEFTGYYKNMNDVITALFGGGKSNVTATCTILADNPSVTGDLYIQNGNNLTLDGGSGRHAFTASKAFRVLSNGSLTLKNLDVVNAENATNEWVIMNNGNATATFENCTFTTTSTYKRSGGLFSLNTNGAQPSVTFKNCSFSVDATSSFATQKDTALFMRYNGTPSLMLEGTTLDISATDLMLCNDPNFTLTVAEASSVKTAQITNVKDVTVANSTMECTSDSKNLFHYDGRTQETTVKAVNATLVAKTNVFNISACSAALTVSLEGNTVLNAGKRALSVTNNTCAVKVTASGSTELRGNGGEDNTVYVCGKDANASFTLIMQDNAKLISAKHGISFEHGSAPITKATIALLDYASVQTGSDSTFMLASTNVAERAITYIRSDRATVTTKTELGSAGKFGKTTIYTPAMKEGASVRIVEGSNGLRFTSTLANGAAPTRYGTLIVKAADLGSTEFTIAALTEAGITFANIEATEAGTVAGTAETTYNAALTNLPEDQLTTDFAARAYAVYTIDGVEYIVYSDFVVGADGKSDNIRNISDVAEAAHNDTKTERTDEYCHEVAEGVWSPYTKEQYDLLLTFVKKK